MANNCLTAIGSLAVMFSVIVGCAVDTPSPTPLDAFEATPTSTISAPKVPTAAATTAPAIAPSATALARPFEQAKPIGIPRPSPLPAAVPTPGPAAMTVYVVTNDNPYSIVVRHIITDTVSFRHEFSSTVPANSAMEYHLRDIPGVPNHFSGAMTLRSDDKFTAVVVGYDYPSSPAAVSTPAARR